MDDKTLHNLLIGLGQDGAQLGDVVSDELLNRVAHSVAQAYSFSSFEAFRAAKVHATLGVSNALHSGTVTAFTNCAAILMVRAIVGEVRALLEANLDSGLHTLEEVQAQANEEIGGIVNSLVLTIMTNMILQVNDERTDAGKAPFFGDEAKAASAKARADADKALAEVFKKKG